MYGHTVVNHESIRQVVLAVSKGLQKVQEERIKELAGTRKVRLLFLEVDGLNVHLQRSGTKWVEEKLRIGVGVIQPAMSTSW
jgi:hypothetical protein